MKGESGKTGPNVYVESICNIFREDEIHDLIAKNCPDLLSNFGEPGDGVGDLDLGKLSMSTKSKKGAAAGQ